MLSRIHHPRQGQSGSVLVFFVPAGLLLLPLGPLSEGEARSGTEFAERLGREPTAGRFPPLRGGARRAGESKTNLEKLLIKSLNKSSNK